MGLEEVPECEEEALVLYSECLPAVKRLCPPPQKRKRQQRDEQPSIGTIYRHVKRLRRERKAAAAGVPVAPEELVAAAGVAALAGAVPVQ